MFFKTDTLDRLVEEMAPERRVAEIPYRFPSFKDADKAAMRAGRRLNPSGYKWRVAKNSYRFPPRERNLVEKNPKP